MVAAKFHSRVSRVGSKIGSKRMGLCRDKGRSSVGCCALAVLSSWSAEFNVSCRLTCLIGIFRGLLSVQVRESICLLRSRSLLVLACQ